MYEVEGKLLSGKKCMKCLKIVHPAAYSRHMRKCFQEKCPEDEEVMIATKKLKRHLSYMKKKASKLSQDSNTVTEEFECEICETKFNRKGALTRHIQQVHTEERQCDKCDHISKSKMEFKQHSYTHRFTKLTSGKFQCNFCDIQLEPHQNLSKHSHQFCDLCSYSCTNKDSLEKHKNMMHSVDISFRFLCDKCDFKAITNQCLKKHQRGVHEGKTNICDICGKGFKSLDVHMKLQHSDGPDKLNCDICHKSIKATQLQAHKAKKHQHCICTFCNKFFEYKSHLLSHYSKEHQVFCLNGERFACHICKKPQETLEELSAHLKEEHLLCDEHPCSKCEISFPTKTSLAIHMLDLHGYKEKDAAIMLGTIKVMEESTAIDDRKFSCEVCLRKFSSEKSLIGHKKQFHEKHDFKCDQCDFTTYENYRLKYHKLHRHEKGTRFPCDQCSYATNFRSTLNKHIKAQHEKRFDHSCTVCGKGFRVKTFMAKHMLHKHDIVIDYQNRFAPVTVK